MKKVIPIFFVILLLMSCESNFSAESVIGGSGRGGSLARFAVVENYLYVVDNNNLKVFDVNNPLDPTFLNSTPIEAFAETIFPFGENLLIGTRTGMYVYNISQPAKPAFVSVYSHFASCDPVVAEGDFAYVTLRNGTPCMRGQNQLDILNISNLSNPRFLKSIPLMNPHGLGVNGNVLFVTEGDEGLRVFDRTDPTDPKLLKFMSNIPAFDVIPLDKTVIVTGRDGVYQFAYTQQGDLEQLSKIAVVN
jgi:hypothetical protein